MHVLACHQYRYTCISYISKFSIPRLCFEIVVTILMNLGFWKVQWSFCVCAQPVRRHYSVMPSLIGWWIHRMIPVSQYVSYEFLHPNSSGWVLKQRFFIGFREYPDSKVNGANMGPTRVLSAPGGPHIGPMKLAITTKVCGYHTFIIFLAQTRQIWGIW